MTFDATKPASNESPSDAPSQIQTNWSRLQTLIGADHQFNAGAATNDGYHKVVRWTTQGSSPSYINGTGQSFVKNASVTVNAVTQTAGHLFHRTSDGTTTREAPLSVLPVRASVSFVSRTSLGNCTLNSAYNVTSVAWTSKGRYTITFTNNMPSTYYLVIGNPFQTTIDTDTRAASIVTREKNAGTVLITISTPSSNQDIDGSVDLIVFGG